MNPSRIFIERPVATSLLMVAILISGLLGYHFLPISALPQVEYPTITVTTLYPGAGPDVMATSVTAPLETQLGQMPGLEQMTSQSSGGASVVTLRFGLDMAMDIAEQEVQAAINQSNSLLPTDLPAPPIYAKVNPADTPVLTLGITSTTLPLTEVEDYVNTRLQQKISQISGVGLVTLSGGNRKAIRVRINIPKLTSYGIAIDTVRTIITTVNINSPTGTFDGPHRSTSLRIDGQIKSIDQLMNQVIAYQNNGPIRLRDVGEVVQGPEDEHLAAWADTKPALILNVQRQPGANVMSVVDNVMAILPQIRTTLPPGIEITPLTDRTVTIRASVEDVEFELAMAMVLVVLVIFVFLRNVPATIIPSLSVPLSLIGTLAIMYLLGFSLDNLSLMALTISTGFVVDDAIVVIENIARYVEMGEDRYSAALKGSQEIGFTIISLTVSLVAVLIPLLFMSDVLGRLFHEFAMTLAITITLSAVISLTLVPMMCARMLAERAHDETQGTWFQRWSARVEHRIDAIIAGYGRWLDVVLRYRVTTLLVAIGTFVLTVVLAVIIPKGFFPVQDTGVVQGITQMSQAISFEGMKRHQEEVAQVVMKDPDVASLSSFVGIDGQNMTLNQGRMLINLKPLAQRTSSLSEIQTRIMEAADKVPGAKLYLQPVQDLSLDSSIAATQYQFMLENPEYDAFKIWVPKFIAALQKEPALSDVTSDLQAEGLVAHVDLDRTNGARYSITPQTIDNLLYDSYGQRQISTIYTQANQYRVILEADPSLQGHMDSLSQLYLPGISSEMGQSSSGPSRSPTSGLVPLSQVTTISRGLAPLLISHYGQFPATTVSFNVADGYSLGAATSAIERVEKAIALPATFQTAFQGTAAAFRNSLGNELYLVLAALVAVYIILGILYESFIHPITIISTLPSAAIGALLSLSLFGMDLDVMGIIGIVLLIGIVKKNAIMMIDFALEAERIEGMSPIESIRHAALLRFRPILMTTLAAFFGALPLMLGHGVGSELRRPLGVSIVGGLLLSQILTLFTTPVVYLFMDDVGAHATPVGHAPGRSENSRTGWRVPDLSRPFILRPVATTLLTVGLLIGGVLGYTQLPVADLPNVDMPVIMVQAQQPGGSPTEIASTIAEPLERYLGSIAGVTEMTSQSMVNQVRITLQFDLSRDVNGAARDVEAALQAARQDLPAGSLRSNPTYQKANPNGAPIMVLALTSQTRTPAAMCDFATNVLQQQMSQIDGVGGMEVGGGALPAVRVEINPLMLYQYGISFEDVRAALASANAHTPKGFVDAGDMRFMLDTNDQAETAQAYRDLIIAYRNGRPVRLADLSTVRDSVENLRTAGYFNGDRAVVAMVFPQAGANVVKTIDQIKNRFALIRSALPPDVDLHVAVDRGVTIRAALADTKLTLVISVVLVVLVVLVFLRSLSAIMIPAIVVPTSIVATFGGMRILGYQLDNMSLMALTISTGFVVDDAIVVLENVTRYLERGMAPLPAALRGAGEVSFTVISITVSLIAVFAPILMLGGMAGRLFHEFAITISLTLAISMLMSLSLTPMMCALLLKPSTGAEEATGIGARIERGIRRVTTAYTGTLDWALSHQFLMILTLPATLLIAAGLFVKMPKGFFPTEDTGIMMGHLEGDETSSFQQMSHRTAVVARVMSKDRDVQNVVGFVGGRQANTANLFTALTPKEERDDTVADTIVRITRHFAKMVGARFYLMEPGAIRGGARGGNAAYQYSLQGQDASELYDWTPRLVSAFQSLPELMDVSSDLSEGGAALDVHINRDTAARVQITPQLVSNILYDAYGQRAASVIYKSINQYRVIMEAEPRFWSDPSTLWQTWISTSGGTASGAAASNNIRVRATQTATGSTETALAEQSYQNQMANSLAGGRSASSGSAVSTSAETMVPLTFVAHVKPGTTALSVNHQGQSVTTTIAFNLRPGVSLGTAVTAINAAMVKAHLPSDIQGAFAGNAALFQKSVNDEPLMILAALAAVYIVLGILYESLVHPLTILSTLPSAGVGALLALQLFGEEFSLIAMIGVILLIGIVKKNAIMLVDFAIQAQREGATALEAIREASHLRFRPIIMTSLAAALGAVPLIISNGYGSELRRPLGIAILGGLVVSQALTLYTTPAVFLLLDRMGVMLRRAAHRFASLFHRSSHRDVTTG